MRADLWARVTALMFEALDVPEAERRGWVEGRAAGDGELIAEVTRLLEAHAAAGRFLEDPLIAEPASLAALHDALPAVTEEPMDVGSLLGDYRILREIGRGGMGAVYLGTRADDVFDKLVAIKVVPGALVSGALRERFARERQLLAGLDHPGIARVLDGGTTAEGLPFLVMEYVDGVPIDLYCDARRLDVGARLRLFLEVCRAVHYAHLRLTLHRDIKAGNVLIDGDGRTKLLDFGIGKLILPDDSRADPSATIARAWTPESASPEQVRGEPTTIATDVYGLGALLYRLLTGQAVFELSHRDQFEQARIICETAPKRPSAAAGRSGGSAFVPAGDLDAIVLKALHKEPTRRYESAAHLAEDIERHLAHRPVLAAPDRWQYRARKFVGRHPSASSASLVALLAVFAATSLALWQARRANQERDRAQARLMDVRRLANTLIFDVFDRIENSPNATPIRRALAEKGLAYLDGVAEDTGSDPVLTLELADAYRRLAEVQGARGQANLGDRNGAVRSFEKGRALLAPFLGSAQSRVEIEVAHLNITRQLAWTLANQPDRSQPLMAESVQRAIALRDRYPGNTAVNETLADTYFFAALAAPPDQQLALWMEANRVYRGLIERAPVQVDHLRSLALTEKYIGGLYHSSKQFDFARAHYERALELDRQVQAIRPASRQTAIDLAIDLANVASMHRAAVPPRLAEALSLYRESLDLRERAVAQDPQDVFARQALGFCLTQLSDLARESGERDAAVSYGRRAVDTYESLPAAEHLARRAAAWLALGKAATESGRLTQGCSALERAREYVAKAMVAPPNERTQLEPDTLPSVNRAREACSRP